MDGLPAGDYTITETDSGPLVLNSVTGGKGDGSAETKSVTVTVTAGDTAAAQSTAQAAFTNNVETRSLTVTKAWNDSVDHSSDTITFALYQVAATIAENDNDRQIVYEGEYNKAYTNTITGSGTVTISNLPKTGVYTDANGSVPVTYEYYVIESVGKAGYIQVVSHDDAGDIFTITNIAPNENNKTTSITVTKKWQDENGQDSSAAHANDEIVFKLIQTKKMSGYVPVTLELFDAHGQRNALETYYVKKGDSFTLTTTKARTYLTHRVSVTTSRGASDSAYWDNNQGAGSHDFTFNNITGAITISAQLHREYHGVFYDGYDKWGDGTAASDWTWGHSVSSANLKTSEAQVAEAATSGSVVGDPQEYSFTMHQNELTGGTNDFTKSAQNWVGTVGNLPLIWKIDDEFYAYYYEITEVSVNGEQVQYDTQTSGSVSTGHTSLFDVTVDQNTNTITNREKPKVFSLNILKVDNTGQGNPKPLPDARFELQKINDDGGASNNGNPQSKTSDSQGQVAFTDLEIGYYMVTEKEPPAGYVLADDPVFYVKVSKENGVQLLVKGEGSPSTWVVDSDGAQGEVISFEAQGIATANPSATATVKNAPGAALPHTGGPGTHAYTILGSVIIAACAAVAVRRLRSRGVGVASVWGGDRHDA